MNDGGVRKRKRSVIEGLSWLSKKWRKRSRLHGRLQDGGRWMSLPDVGSICAG
jgi:hypothetical protein